MLASLIPGVREIRAPLAAGYLWLFALWLALEPFPSKEGATGLTAAVIDLTEAATPVAVAVALSFAAYLIGSISDGLVRAIRAWWAERRHWHTDSELASRSANLRPSDTAHSSLMVVGGERIQEAEGRLQGFGRKLEDLPSELLPGADQPTATGRDLHTRMAWKLGDQTISDLPLIATRLMGEQAELFSAVDRLRAEADLRWSVAPPLAAALVVLAIRSHWTWLFGLVFVALIAYQGLQREREAADLVVDAVFIGRVEAPAFERLRRATEQVSAP